MKEILLDTNLIIQFKEFEKCDLNEGVNINNVKIFITDISLLELKEKLTFSDLKTLCYLVKKYDLYLIKLNREQIKIETCRFIFERIKHFYNLKDYKWLESVYEVYYEKFHKKNMEIYSFLKRESKLKEDAKVVNIKSKEIYREQIKFIKDSLPNDEFNNKIKKKVISKIKKPELIKIDLETKEFKSKNTFNSKNDIIKHSQYFKLLIKDLKNNNIKDNLTLFYRILEFVSDLDSKRILFDMKPNNHKNMLNDILILVYSLFLRISLVSSDEKILKRAIHFNFSSMGFFPIPIMITNGKLKTIDKVALYNF